MSKRVLETTKKITSSEKIKLIYNGVNFDNFNLNQEKKKIKRKLGFFNQEKIFLSVGRLKKAKGYPYLLKAISKINLPNTRLVILGEGEERKKIESLIKKLKIGDKVILKGRVNNVEEYLQIADLFIMSSLWEGFSIALLEAGYFGLPVIATDVGGNSEVIENKRNGFLIKPKSVKAIKEAILKFISLSDKEKKKLSRNIKEKVRKKFSTKRMIKQHDNLYKKVLLSKK